MSQLMAFDRFYFNIEVHEELGLCEPLKERRTGEDIFSMLNDFFNKNNVLWKTKQNKTLV